MPENCKKASDTQTFQKGKKKDPGNYKIAYAGCHLYAFAGKEFEQGQLA